MTRKPPASSRQMDFALRESRGMRLYRLKQHVLGWWHRNDLNRLAFLFNTDKWGSHWYTQHYQRYFRPIKNKKLAILEIGVGGYRDPRQGAQSLRMWKAFFRNSRIYGIDYYDKSQFSESRIDIWQCDQTDSDALRDISDRVGGFDIVIDDGSHRSDAVKRSFAILFPLLHTDGIYAVEDLQTAYWPSWGGGMSNPESSMEFFKSLVDGLNHVEFPIANYAPSYFEQNISEIAFFHNLVIVRKGRNSEESNAPALVRREIALAEARLRRASQRKG